MDRLVLDLAAQYGYRKILFGCYIVQMEDLFLALRSFPRNLDDDLWIDMVAGIMLDIEEAIEKQIDIDYPCYAWED